MKRKLPVFLTSEEEKLLLKQPNRRYKTGLRNYAIMQTMLKAGLRVSEAANLQEKDIDKEKADILVREGKGDKDRLVPVPFDLIDIIERWIAIKPTALYLFTTLKGGRLDERYIREMIYRYRKKAGIEKKVSPHTLRHTYATNMISNVNIRELQELLGHSDISTTMIYTHVNPVDLRNKIQNKNKF